MDPPHPGPDWVELIEWLEFWLELLRRDPGHGPTVLPFAEADLNRLKSELMRSAEGERSSLEVRSIAARSALRICGELALEIAKRIVNGDISGSFFRPRIAAA